MARYLVIHSPLFDLDGAIEDGQVQPPSRMVDLAREHGQEGANPRWLRAWSPDLHDDRIFSLWEATNAAEIGDVLDRYGFLAQRTAEALRVAEWGPHELLAELEATSKELTS